MRTYIITLVTLFCSLNLFSQNILYRNIESFTLHHGDTILSLSVIKRSSQDIMLFNGGRYKISSPNKSLSRYIRSKCLLAQVDTLLYINCNKVSYKRYKFGKYFERAFLVGDNLYFSSEPLGQAATRSFTKGNNKLNGEVGDAIAASCISSYVIYQFDLHTGQVHFISRETLVSMIPNISESLKEKILSIRSDDANLLLPYLKLIK